MCCGGGDKDDKYGDAQYEDPNYEGPSSDPKLAEGPFPDDQRGCTDILCCLFFIIFMGGMGYVASIGMATGKPLNLMDMYDADGLPCGREGTARENYPFLYFWLPITG